jgi:hypothetical protein
MRSQRRERHRRCTKGQGRCNDNQAHRFIEDHSLKRRETKRADQQRQPKFRTAKTDQTPERANDGTADERDWRATGGTCRKIGGRHRPALQSQNWCCCERLKHALGDAPWPFSQTECAGRITAWIDLDRLGANRDLYAAPCQTPQHATCRRAQRESVYRRHGVALGGAITDAGSGFEPARLRRIDEARAADTANRSRLAAERECCAGFDDFAEPLAPLGFNREIDGFAGNKIRAEPNCQRGEPALSFRHRALAHSCIDDRRPSRRPDHFQKRRGRDRHHIAAFNPCRNSAAVCMRTAVKLSRVAQPSKTASAKAMPRRGVDGAGSSCRATE